MTWVVYACIVTIVCFFLSLIETLEIWGSLAYFTELLLLLGVVISLKIPDLLYRKLMEMKVKISYQNDKMAPNSFIKKMRIIQSVLLDSEQTDGRSLQQNPFLIEILSSIESFKHNAKQSSLNYLVDLKEGVTLYDPKTNSQIAVGLVKEVYGGTDGRILDSPDLL